MTSPPTNSQAKYGKLSIIGGSGDEGQDEMSHSSIEYVPGIQDLIDAYTYVMGPGESKSRREVAKRILAKHDAEVAAIAWEEGFTTEVCDTPTRNPYREEA